MLITIHYLLPNYTVSKLFVLYTHLFTIKIFLPRNCHNYFTENYKIHDYNTRNKNNLHLSAANFYYGSKAITFESCSLWNQLPEYLENVQIPLHLSTNLGHFFIVVCLYVKGCCCHILAGCANRCTHVVYHSFCLICFFFVYWRLASLCWFDWFAVNFRSPYRCKWLPGDEL